MLQIKLMHSHDKVFDGDILPSPFSRTQIQCEDSCMMILNECGYGQCWHLFASECWECSWSCIESDSDERIREQVLPMLRYFRRDPEAWLWR
jgi:hypothetical protein